MSARAPRRRARAGRRPRACACAGVSLVELMIAMTLGLFVVAVLGQLYGGASRAYALNETLARLNENGRFASDFLSSDLRMAGYLSCGGASARVGNSIDAPGHWLYRTGALEGYEGGVDALPSELSGEVRSGTDVLIVRHTAVDVERTLIEEDSRNAVMSLGLDHGFEVGEILVVTNPSCTQTALFQVTRVMNLQDEDATEHFDAVEHRAGDADEQVAPGNCTHELFGSFDCSAPGKAENGTFTPGSVVNRYAVHAYYVSAADPPTLTRKRLSHSGLQAGIVTEGLIRDVENLQVLYGRDTSADGEDSVDDYVAADAVDDWSEVVSVRFALLMRSRDVAVRVDGGQRTFDLVGTAVVSPADRHLRRTFGGLVALRNTLP